MMGLSARSRLGSIEPILALRRPLMRRPLRKLPALRFYSIYNPENPKYPEDPEQPGKFLSAQIIRTLDKAKLEAADHIDLSGIKQRRIWFETAIKTPFILRYGRERLARTEAEELGQPQVRLDPFPIGTQGFLYYHPPTSPYHYPLRGLIDHGHFRFRLATPDQASFDSGIDLTHPSGALWTFPTGLTWRAPLPSSELNPVAAMVHRDRLATRAELARWRDAREGRTVRFEQPFLFDFALPYLHQDVCYFIDDGGARWSWAPFCHTENKKPIWSRGAAEVQLEASERGKQGEPISAVMRILKIYEAFVASEHMNKVGRVHAPEPGDLFKIHHRQRGAPHTVWSLVWGFSRVYLEPQGEPKKKRKQY